ncbi:MAG TPA: type VI secretion system tip protein TssI/VgrG [Polyangium sp.]|nr:type VI secretion system tip protein TssI/VgrG [Polyangium sp.]
MPLLELSFSSKEDSLSVRHFAVREEISGLFTVDILARSRLDEIDLEGIVNHGAGFGINSGVVWLTTTNRVWTGICSHMELVQTESIGLSTYFVKIVPSLWRTTMRRNSRIFQHLTIPDILKKVFAEWQIEPEWKLTAQYPEHEYRVQYGETDFAFISRLLEEAGITYFFTHDPPQTKLVLTDKPTAPGPRPALPFVDNPNQEAEKEFATKVKLTQKVKPGRFTFRDFDFRKNLDYQLFCEARAKTELPYEQYYYEPGAFWFEPGQGGDTPVADDKGVARTNEREGTSRATRELDASRRTRRVVSYKTNVLDLSPGTLLSISPHPRGDISGKNLLAIYSELEGTPDQEWWITGEAVYADAPYRPERRTIRPRIRGVQSAVVVGPKGEEIFVDEFGRVRVQFHWDREGKYDENSSCWMRVSQNWAGAGYGFLSLPRVGQEVLVEFFEGDPDRPIVTGRVYSQTRQVLYKLPDNKTKSGWKTETYPGAGGFNELSFEDAKAREEIHIQAQKDFTEIVKNNQTSTVRNNRSASVTSNDSWTVGGSQSFSVGLNQSTNIGQYLSIDIGDSRTSTISVADTIAAGEVIMATIGQEGVGFIYAKDQTILITNAVASIGLSEGGLFLNSKADLKIHADGTLRLSGKDIIIDGKPNVYFNLESKRLRLEKRLAMIAAARKKAEGMPPGPERDALLAAASRLERNNRAVERARLAADVYNTEGAPEGWERLPPDINNPDTGFYAATYKSRIDGQIVVAYRGTEPGTYGDWFHANIPQGRGKDAPQYAQAAAVGRQMRELYGPNVEFTGHSLGGGLAATGAMAAGTRADTFNAAGIHENTYGRYNLDPSVRDRIHNYRNDGEILTGLQERSLVRGLAPDAVGHQHDLPAVHVKQDGAGNTILDGNGNPQFSATRGFDPLGALEMISPAAWVINGISNLIEGVARHSEYIDGLEYQKTQDINAIAEALKTP